MYLILSKANFGGQSIAVLMVLDTSLYKVLSWSFMGLIRSELKLRLYCFGIRIQEFFFHSLYRSKTNYMQLNRLNIKKTTRAKLSPFVIYIKTIIYCGSFINFIVAAVFINRSNM